MATDIAGMTYDHKSRSLIFVSHEGVDDGSIGPATVFTSDLSGKLLSGPLKLQGAQPEGTVMKDASTMYIIGEPAEVQMYVSPLRGDCPPGCLATRRLLFASRPKECPARCEPVP